MMMKFFTRFSILLMILGMTYVWMKMVTMAPRQRVVTGQTESRVAPRRTSITLDSFLHAQQLRKKQLRRFCTKFPELRSLNASDSAEHLLSSMTLSHKLTTLYCKPADVTIGAWEELVQSIERRSDVTLRSPLPVDHSGPDRLAKDNPAMLAQVLRTYTKVLFIGDPYERLVSLYLQGSAGETTFQEFIEDVLMEAGEGGVSSSSIVHSCSPCFVQYDYLVMTDFLRAELPHLMKRLGLPESVELPASIDQDNMAASRWLSKNLFRGLSQEQLEQVTQLYSWDFAAFPLRNSLVGDRTVAKNVSRS